VRNKWTRQEVWATEGAGSRAKSTDWGGTAECFKKGDTEVTSHNGEKKQKPGLGGTNKHGPTGGEKRRNRQRGAGKIDPSAKLPERRVKCPRKKKKVLECKKAEWKAGL